MTETFKTANEALIYMTECTLATIEWLRMKKRTPRSELQRQVAIAQAGVTYIKNAKLSVGLRYTVRVREVLVKYDGNVSTWAAYDTR